MAIVPYFPSKMFDICVYKGNFLKYFFKNHFHLIWHPLKLGALGSCLVCLHDQAEDAGL